MRLFHAATSCVGVDTDMTLLPGLTFRRPDTFTVEAASVIMDPEVSVRFAPSADRISPITVTDALSATDEAVIAIDRVEETVRFAPSTD